MNEFTDEQLDEITPYIKKEILCIDSLHIPSSFMHFRGGKVEKDKYYELTELSSQTFSVPDDKRGVRYVREEYAVINGIQFNYGLLKKHFRLITKEEMRKLKIDNLLDENDNS